MVRKVKFDIKDLESIKLLVDRFYASVRNDELLGPVFADVIKDDWQPHLDKMYAFWNAALFCVAGFRGNPFARHAPLSIQPQHFDRWLQVFNQTVNDNFEGPMADDAKKRAELMSIMFQAKLSRVKDGFSKIIV
ncbi:group III truncated hemoglobin [Mucilaginibacter sp. PAMB04168]|uniref:group III truncated hemoglobin n=1 Tax=Mucilaginibacter sp. PAMB04168 TaxID=3138567 RepID=UPI0031F63505